MKVFIYTCILFYQSNNFLCVMCKEHYFKHNLFMLCHFIRYVKKKTTFTGIIKFSMLIINASASNINVCHVYAGYKIEYLLMHVDGKWTTSQYDKCSFWSEKDTQLVASTWTSPQLSGSNFVKDWFLYFVY